MSTIGAEMIETKQDAEESLLFRTASGNQFREEEVMQTAREPTELKGIDEPFMVGI